MTPRKVAEAAAAYAKANGAAGTSPSSMKRASALFMRLDGSSRGASVSIGKARTSATFKKATKEFEDIINKAASP